MPEFIRRYCDAICNNPRLKARRPGPRRTGIFVTPPNLPIGHARSRVKATYLTYALRMGALRKSHCRCMAHSAGKSGDGDGDDWKILRSTAAAAALAIVVRQPRQ